MYQQGVYIAAMDRDVLRIDFHDLVMFSVKKTLAVLGIVRKVREYEVLCATYYSHFVCAWKKHATPYSSCERKIKATCWQMISVLLRMEENEASSAMFNSFGQMLNMQSAHRLTMEHWRPFSDNVLIQQSTLSTKMNLSCLRRNFTSLLTCTIHCLGSFPLR